MKITIAKTSGFCMGVRRAVEMVLDTANRVKGPVYTFGPLIHNPQVMHMLAEKGVEVLEEIPEKGEGTVLIRAHGVTPETRGRLEAAGFTVIDATCPRVIKVQRLLDKYQAEGYTPIIVGDADHPEVIGLVGHARGHAYVVRSREEALNLPKGEKAVLVAQTTQDQVLYLNILEAVRERFDEIKDFNTICDSTARRQEEARGLAHQVEAMVVVGGKSSGNTQRLAQIAAGSGVPTFHVETEKELDVTKFQGMEHVGITAGASTPNWIIRRVHQAVADPGVLGRSGAGLGYSVRRFLIQTNLYLAFSAGCLCFACMLLLGQPPSLDAPIIAASYILLMHISNNFIGRNAARYNDPDRARFYDQHKIPLAALAIFGGAPGFVVAFELGWASFLTLVIITGLGLSYNVPIWPEKLRFFGRYQKMRSIPGSKTIFIAGAWAGVTAVLPVLSHGAPVDIGLILVIFFATAMVLARTSIFDVLDVQIDRMVSYETIATWIGPAKTLKLIRVLLVALAGVLIIGGVLSWLPSLAFWLLPCALFPLLVTNSFAKGKLHPGHRLELLVDTNFVLAGAIAVFWQTLI
ncbi:4-hydroxy-3-methylbut-2-enyl diphosphate reductase [Desulfatibacillum aliphaticivorans]|uniref:4-hydroxy-3-methylbut-2-enyl diphosphate reductase n=1 Tax=Desulfatibacillum aliphaticivorans TaxID=218208 RepID=UPI00042667A2|nr:4-hydroxy-3-methylbut-2-enyl diphosphate reductase [Desulfatibacillum aliphaticivorans]